ncbi:anthranilate synthase component I [Hyphomicrobium methylovorum]|uniref:anthranilate synthase component I n=1 Tax=Hyphomicrobium methylovorum TaxID=84 RepID=UPI0015E6BB66|nr:anthranilate synthase component I [Hyphomicrobium methylovorum]
MNQRADGEFYPPFEAFAKTYDAGTPQVVWTRLVADLETPVSAYLKLCDRRPMSFLLESIEGGEARGRYSVIGFAPDLIWQAVGNTASVNRTPLSDPASFVPDDQPALQSLRALLDESAIQLPDALPPMAAGIFGFMGYDTVRLIENLPEMSPDALGVPDSILIRPTLMLIFDNVRDEMILVSPARPDATTSAAEAYENALARLDAAVQSLDTPLPHGASATGAAVALPEPKSNTAAADYLAMVDKAKDYIRAGDIFQVVLSQRFSAPFELPSFALYRSLRRLNPSPFLFHLDFGEFQLVGSSPEILVRVRDGVVTIRPIAGTTRRGSNDAEDKALATALLNDPKERSEHLMLLDLGRNDVGRVSLPGTVSVTDKFIVERYSHVMHIVSNVIGNLDSEKFDSIDALMAGFPAGTVSGAPKVRAMEIIAELEKAKRGPYAGCVGYFSAGGEMDTCIVLRTAILKDGKIHIQAGAGVVHDSIPENEQQECINKAKAVVRAAEEAVRFATNSRKTDSSSAGNGGPFA